MSRATVLGWPLLTAAARQNLLPCSTPLPQTDPCVHCCGLRCLQRCTASLLQGHPFTISISTKPNTGECTSLPRCTPVHVGLTARGLATGYQHHSNTHHTMPFPPSWATRLAVGTPPQTFQAMMDTGSGLVWLPSKGCGTNCSQGLPADAGFDASASSTFHSVGCDDPSCNASFCQECACSTSQPGSCGYSLEYMEGGTAVGAWVQDSVQLPGLVLADKANASLKFGLQQGTTGNLQQQNIHALIGAWC